MRQLLVAKHYQALAKFYCNNLRIKRPGRRHDLVLTKGKALLTSKYYRALKWSFSRLWPCTLWSLCQVHLIWCWRILWRAGTARAKARLLSVILFTRPGGRSSTSSRSRCPPSVPCISPEMCSRSRSWPSCIIVSIYGPVAFVESLSTESHT